MEKDNVIAKFRRQSISISKDLKKSFGGKHNRESNYLANVTGGQETYSAFNIFWKLFWKSRKIAKNDQISKPGQNFWTHCRITFWKSAKTRGNIRRDLVTKMWGQIMWES